MDSTFSINVDRARGMLRVTLGGFFTTQDVGALVARRAEAYPQLGLAAGAHVTLADVSACALQAQEVVQAFQAMMRDEHYRSRRLAVVVGSSLARMQVRRIIEREGVRMFERADDAEAWLTEPQPDVRAA